MRLLPLLDAKWGGAVAPPCSDVNQEIPHGEQTKNCTNGQVWTSLRKSRGAARSRSADLTTVLLEPGGKSQVSLWKRLNSARPGPRGRGVGAVSVHPENEQSAMLETNLSVPFYGHVRQYHNIKAEIDAKNQEDLESGQSVMGRCGRARQPPPIAAVPYAVGIPPPERTVPIFPRLRRQKLTRG
jgi:hypothetical protein